MQPLVELLKDSDEELKCLAAETIAHCAKNGMLIYDYASVYPLTHN